MWSTVSDELVRVRSEARLDVADEAQIENPLSRAIAAEHDEENSNEVA